VEELNENRTLQQQILAQQAAQQLQQQTKQVGGPWDFNCFNFGGGGGVWVRWG
jgi:hypothetical protein